MLASDTYLPSMVRIHREISAPQIPDPEAAARSEYLACRLERWVKPGARIAVGCGSRGISCYAQIVRGVIAALQEVGAKPFIIPAMGSHGGATALGQIEVLAAAGITESTMGVPIISSMDVLEIDHIPGGPPVLFDRNAAAADGIVPINRVKAHTDFQSVLASGLIKMLVIGFGKERGASAVHAYGVPGLRDYIPQIAQRVLHKLPILPGLAIVENAHEQPALLRALPPDRMFTGEQELLTLARKWMGRLPVDDLDMLVLDEMGKDISGTGMDTNVIGRLVIAREEEFVRPKISRIAVLDLTSSSHGNAVGVGLCDLITERLRQKIDLHATNLNAVTSTFLERGRIPVALPTDKEAISTALRCAWQPDPSAARVIRAKNTLELSELYVSTAVWAELQSHPDCAQLGEPEPWRFTASGDLDMPWHA